MSWKLGIDVGGTFTDFVLANSSTGKLISFKEPSQPADPAAAINQGLARLLDEAEVPPGGIGLVAHGTTLGLNAILQRKGARLGLVVSLGNKDVLQIARMRMADAYGFFARPAAPLVSRDLVFEIATRLGADGRYVVAPNEADIERVSGRIRAAGCEAVAVALLNSFINPGLERDVAEAIGRRVGIPVLASTEILPEIREYERAMAALLNLSITPIMTNYYRKLVRGLAGLGVKGDIVVTGNNGGTIDIATATRRPIESVLSGPAAGVVAAIHIARGAGISNIVTFDMGGTSADISICEAAELETTTQAVIGDFPIGLPAVNVSAIGAGGGSIVRVDDEGLLKVGPLSAGADPGPVCYGRGGTDATITDCYLTCGILDPLKFLGGAFVLDKGKAQGALGALGSRLGIAEPENTVRTAAAAITIATSIMAAELRKILARRGADPATYALVPYGGAGPTHAAMVAEDVGIDRVLVPPRPGTLCAMGGVIADLRRSFSRSTKVMLNDGTSEDPLRPRIEDIVAEARGWIDTISVPADSWRYEVMAEARYVGEAFALPITFDLADDLDIPSLVREKFHFEHKRLYSFADMHASVEIGRIAVTAIGLQAGKPEPRPDDPALPQGAVPTRRIFLADAWWDASVFDRSGLAPGNRIPGPAIIEQYDTTTFVPSGWSASCLKEGSLILEKDNART